MGGRKGHEKICGIYKITNPSGQMYIGKSKHILKRWRKSGYDRQRLILASFKDYGYENHIFEIVERCDLGMLNERERFYVKHFGTFNTPQGLNLTDGGNHFDFSNESKEIIKKVVTGNTNWLGKKHKEETKIKQSVNSGQSKLVLDTKVEFIIKA